MKTVIMMTLTEILRKRVILLTLLMTAAFLALFAYAVTKTALGIDVGTSVDNTVKNYLNIALLLSVGFFFGNFVIAYLVIFSAAGSISSEIESGLLLAILPRPIMRWQVYMGKWLGYAIWSFLYCALLFWALVWIVEWRFPFPFDALTLLKSFGLFVFLPWVLISLSMLGSTYLPTLGNGVVITLLFSLGLLGGMLERIAYVSVMKEATKLGLLKIGLITSLIIPTDSIYRRMTYELTAAGDIPFGQETMNILGPFANPSAPSNAFLIYTFIYMCIIIAWGILRFNRKDI